MSELTHDELIDSHRRLQKQVNNNNNKRINEHASLAAKVAQSSTRDEIIELRRDVRTLEIMVKGMQKDPKEDLKKPIEPQKSWFKRILKI